MDSAACRRIRILDWPCQILTHWQSSISNANLACLIVSAQRQSYLCKRKKPWESRCDWDTVQFVQGRHHIEAQTAQRNRRKESHLCDTEKCIPIHRSPGLRVKYSTLKSCHFPSLFVGRFTYGFLSKKYGLWAAIATTTLKNISSMKQELLTDQILFLLTDQILFIRKKKKRKRGNVRKKTGEQSSLLLSPTLRLPTTQRRNFLQWIVGNHFSTLRIQPSYQRKIYRDGIFKEVSVYRRRVKLINEGASPA